MNTVAVVNRSSKPKTVMKRPGTLPAHHLSWYSIPTYLGTSGNCGYVCLRHKDGNDELNIIKKSVLYLRQTHESCEGWSINRGATNVSAQPSIILWPRHEIVEESSLHRGRMRSTLWTRTNSVSEVEQLTTVFAEHFPDACLRFGLPEESQKIHLSNVPRDFDKKWELYTSQPVLHSTLKMLREWSLELNYVKMVLVTLSKFVVLSISAK